MPFGCGDRWAGVTGCRSAVPRRRGRRRCAGPPERVASECSAGLLRAGRAVRARAAQQFQQPLNRRALVFHQIGRIRVRSRRRLDGLVIFATERPLAARRRGAVGVRLLRSRATRAIFDLADFMGPAPARTGRLGTRASAALYRCSGWVGWVGWVGWSEVLAPADGAAQVNPVDGPVARAPAALRSAAGLQEVDRLPVESRPILRHPARRAAQQVGGQVRNLG